MFMKRKVVKHGTATLTVSLPVQWVKKFNIKQGDELDVEERGNRVIVKPYNELSEKEIIIELERKEDFLRRLIVIPYSLGYNIIKVRYKDREVLPKIQETISNYFMGFEIVEQNGHYCLIKNIAKGIEEEFDVMLNRLAIITIGMLKDIYDAFKTNRLSLISESRTSEMNANKINLFCRRMLNTIGHKDKTTTIVYNIVCYLEELTDEAHYLSEYAVLHKIKASKNVLNYLQDLIKQLELWYKAFNEYKPEHIIEMKKIEIKLQKEGINLLENSKDVVVVHYLVAMQENIHHMSEGLF